jgi:hypothetical protein
MNWFKRLQIDFQRWRFIKSRSAELRILKKKKQRAIAEADRLCDVDGRRRYVFLVEDSYEILSTLDVNIINRRLKKPERWDIVRIMKECVYKTK